MSVGPEAVVIGRGRPWGSRLGHLLWFPVRMAQAWRGALTAGSTTLVFFLVLSMNVVWGYPWIGIFAACFSMLLIGFIASRIFAPRFRVGLSLPTSAVAGESWTIRQHLDNTRRLPAMELTVRLVSDVDSGRSADWGMGPGNGVVRVGGGERVTVQGSVVVGRRGVWPLPAVRVESLFPFQLFRATQRLSVEGSIAITPRLLHAHEDPSIRAALSAVNGVASQQSQGASAEYVGSREYQTGMPVRKWDFVSWARLGRPIVREYATPSLQTIAIVVDTADEGDPEKLEHLLSVAATVLVERGRSDIGFRLFVTDGRRGLGAGRGELTSPGDIEPLLIRLAEAEAVDGERADEQITAFLGHATESDLMVLTSRRDPGFAQRGRGRVTLIRVGGAAWRGRD